MNRILAMGWLSALVLCFGVIGLRADEDDATSDSDNEPAASKTKSGNGPKKDDSDKKFRDFADVTKGSEKIDGLYTLHRKDDHLYAEIKSHQLDQPMLAPIAIARGMGMAGQPLNFGDEWVLVFKRVGDKVQLIRRNIHYKAPSRSPIEKAVKQNYTDSVLMALPIVSINQANNNAVVIDLADIFFTDFAQLSFGFLDRNRTSWHKVKGFPEQPRARSRGHLRRRSVLRIRGRRRRGRQSGPDHCHPL